MDQYTATEQAYKHGYEKGYEAGKKDATTHCEACANTTQDNRFKTIVVDDRKHYMVIPDCPIRLVFEDNEYVGWYYAGEGENRT